MLGGPVAGMQRAFFCAEIKDRSAKPVPVGRPAGGAFLWCWPLPARLSADCYGSWPAAWFARQETRLSRPALKLTSQYTAGLTFAAVRRVVARGLRRGIRSLLFSFFKL